MLCRSRPLNLADRDAWLAFAGGINLGPGRVYRLGDATLNGIVDGLDFIRWNSNKFSVSSQWSRGDFNADGIVDGIDFILWNTNKFTSSDSSFRRKGRPKNAQLVDLAFAGDPFPTP